MGISVVLKVGWSFEKITRWHEFMNREINELEENLKLLDTNIWLWFGKVTNLYSISD